MTNNDKHAGGVTQTSSGEHQSNCIVHNIYTKDVSFESPNAPHVFGMDWHPTIDFDLQMSSQHLEKNTWEVVLHVTAKAILKVVVDAEETKDQNTGSSATGAEAKEEHEITAFVAEVQQAGIFSIANEVIEQQRDRMLAIEFPGMLFPYVREQVAGLILKGGFPQMLLPPMNFELMYQRHLQEQELQANADKAVAGMINNANADKSKVKSEEDIKKTPIISMSDPEFNTSKH